MPRTIYALLVGINAYPVPVHPLNGGVNDIQRVHALLKDRIDADSVFKPLVLTDAQATRTGIIEAFRSRLRQAQADDVALFEYSGHVSQAPSPPEFWHLKGPWCSLATMKTSTPPSWSATRCWWRRRYNCR